MAFRSSGRAFPQKAKMVAFGTITSLVVASAGTGDVVLERYYDPVLNSDERERGELVRVLVESARIEGILGGQEAEEGTLSECYTSTYRQGQTKRTTHNLVFQRVSDLVLFCTGTKELSHARVAKVMECFLVCLTEQFSKKAISEERVVKNYAKVCMVIEEMINEVRRSTALSILSQNTRSSNHTNARLWHRSIDQLGVRTRISQGIVRTLDTKAITKQLKQ